MISSEISDLESFIDSYVTLDEQSESSKSWSRTQSSENDQGFSANISTAETSASNQKLGTEIWGHKFSPSDWHAPKPEQDWNDFRPKVQERSLQWQQQVLQDQTHQTQQVYHNSAQQYYPDQQQRYPPIHNDAAFLQQEYSSNQDPNQIQAIVSDFIEQNNMTRRNLPPWVDVTRPPPPFPNATPPFVNYNQPFEEPNIYYNSQDTKFLDNQPILQSMTFHRADVPPSNSPLLTNNIPPSNSPMLANSIPSSNSPMLPNNMPFSNSSILPNNIPPSNSPSLVGNIPPSNSPMLGSNPDYSNAGNYMPNNAIYNNPQHMIPPTAEQTSVAPGPYQNFQRSDSGQLDFQSELMQGARFESPEGFPTNSFQHSAPPRVGTDLNQPNLFDASPSKNELVQNTKQSPEKNKTKYPNSRLRGSRGSGSSVTEEPAAPRTYKNEEVFESESDDRWKTENARAQHTDKKKVLRRKSSAADEDQNWRSRNDGSASEEQKTNNTRNGSYSSAKNDNRERRSDHPGQTRKKSRENQDLSHRDEQKESTNKRRTQGNKQRGGRNVEDGQQRHVADKEKGKVVSWLQKDQRDSEAAVVNEIRRLETSDTEADLTRFIEMTQSFATTEVKMREVAEIICNKALKETRFCRNASILCDRMAFMMVHGTKFRTVVLNVMQGHYKIRDQLYASSYRGDRRWFGFVTFLIEIFINVRTSSRERLRVLVDPVFTSLFQVLTGERIDKEHVECFGRLFEKVGPCLEKEDLDRLNRLVAEIRDRCVVSKSPCVKRVLLRCVESYASKWKRNPT